MFLIESLGTGSDSAGGTEPVPEFVEPPKLRGVAFDIARSIECLLNIFYIPTVFCARMPRFKKSAN